MIRSPSRSPWQRARLRAYLLGLCALLLVVSWPGRAGAAQLAARLEAEQVPAQMFHGVHAVVKVRVTNAGTEAWSPATRDRVAYHWRRADGAMFELDGRRTELPGAVAPGETVEVDVIVRPPAQPGRYRLEWAMVREDVTWFPAPVDADPDALDLWPLIEVGAGDFGWALIERDYVAEMISGGGVGVRVVVENRGEIPWSAASGDALSHHWRDADGMMRFYEGRRTPFPREVGPGERIELELNVEAPPLAGRYVLEVEPVREGVRWYGPPIEAPADWVETLVEPAEIGWRLLDQGVPPTLHAGEAVEVRVELANAGYEPWSATDRLSYRWFDERGRQVAEGPRFELPGSLAPGDSAVVDARVHAPIEPGFYRLAWEPLREHEFWYGPSEDGHEGELIEVERAKLAWKVEEVGELPALWVGEATTVPIRLRNTGAERWSREQGDNLAYHWLDEVGNMVHFDGRRTHLETPVEPGEVVELEARILGPKGPGRYRLQWEMVREHVRWYGGETDVDATPMEPPSEGHAQATVRSRAMGVQAAMAALTLLLAMFVRLRVRGRAGRAVMREIGVVLWTWLAIFVSVLTFAELSGLELWSRATFAAASGAAAFLIPTVLVGPRARPWVAAGTGLVIAFVGLADLVYMHFFGSIVPVAALTASHHVGEVGSSIASLIEPEYGWLFPVPIAGLLAAALLPAINRDRHASRAARTLTAQPWLARLGGAVLVAAAVVPFGIRLGEAMTGNLGKRVFSEQRNTSRFGYLNAHVFDVARSIRERRGRGSATAEETEEIVAHFDARQREISDGLSSMDHVAFKPGIASGANLLLIQVEAAQQWVIGAKVGDQEITPLLNRLHERGQAFPNIVDQTAQGKTSDAEYATLNSQHPLGEGAICFLRADNDFHTLAHVLSAEGYQTFSSHPYKRGFWNRAVLHPKYGFERSMFRRELGPGQDVGWGLADGVFFERVVDELASMQKPWFTFLITLSLHHPYDHFPQNLQELDLGELQGTRVGNYLHAMNYFDRSLGQLLADLDEAGLADDTVVALYGDHDARFDLREHPEILELAGEAKWAPSTDLRHERIPFFVLLPGDAYAGVNDAIGGHVDIAPTLLHHLGVARPRSFAGRPLLPGGRLGYAAYPDGSAFARDRIYIASGRDIPRGGGCFDYPGGSSRTRSDCDELAEWAARELAASRAVVDFDLHQELAGR